MSATAAWLDEDRQSVPTTTVMQRLTVLVFVLAACAGPPTKPVRAMAIASGISNVALARSTAQGRAIEALAQRLGVDAVAFTLMKSGDDSLLTVKTAGVPKVTGTEYSNIQGGGVMATVEAPLPLETANAIKALPGRRADGNAKNADLAVAWRFAESRALRAAAEAWLADTAGASAEGYFRGTMTIRSHLVEFVDLETVKVIVDAHVTIIEKRALGADEKAAVCLSSTREHLALGEREPALAAAAHLRELVPEGKRTPEMQKTLGEIEKTAGEAQP